MEKKKKTVVNRRGSYWYNAETFSEWVHMLGGDAKVADRLGLKKETLQRYCNGTTPIPKAVYVFLELLCTGQLSMVLGKEWGDIRLTPSGLQLPGWRRPFTPQELHSLFVLVNGRSVMLENQLAIAKRDLEQVQAEADEWEKKARFYRNQLALESRLGSMLVRITTP